MNIDVNKRPCKVSVDVYHDLKSAVLGNLNLECIRQYQFQYQSIPEYQSWSESQSYQDQVFVSLSNVSHSLSLRECQSLVNGLRFSLSIYTNPNTYVD